MKKLGTVDVFEDRDELWDYVGDTKVGYRMIVLSRDYTKKGSPVYEVYASNDKQLSMALLLKIQPVVQVLNPRSHTWTLVDRVKGTIIKHSRTSKPYKNIPIIGKEGR